MRHKGGLSQATPWILQSLDIIKSQTSENGYFFLNPNFMFKAPAYVTSVPQQSLSPPTQGTSPLTQSNSPPTQETRPPLQGTYLPTQSTSSPMQSIPPLQGASSPTQCHSSPTQDTSPPSQSTHPPMQGTRSPTQSFSPLTQGTSHSPSLPSDWGHMFCYTHDSNIPPMSDIVQRTVNLQNNCGKSCSNNWHSPIIRDLCNGANNTSKTNTAASPVITASPTKKGAAYSPPASFVTTPFKATITAVYSSSNSGTTKRLIGTDSHLVSSFAAFLSLREHGS